MVELTKTNRITIGVIVFLLIILVGFIFINSPKYSFKKPMREVLSDVKAEQYKVNPQDLSKAILSKDQNKLLIDVRSQYEYAKSHLPEAKNIPTVHLLDDDNFKFFKDASEGGKQVVLYGNTANEASAPFMILYQMGFDNIAYTQVGYNYFEGKTLETVAQSTFDAVDEKPVTDFAQFIKDARQKVQEEQTEVMTSKPVKKPVQIKMQTHSEEGEDEGC